MINYPRRGFALPELRHKILLAGGDALVFLAFAAVGRASHGMSTGPEALLQVVGTAAPFAVAWFVIAPFVGAYRPEVVTRPPAMLARTALAWLIACPVGIGLRAMFLQLFQQRQIVLQATLIFMSITLITVMLILLGWRGVFAWLAGRGK